MDYMYYYIILFIFHFLPTQQLAVIKVALGGQGRGHRGNTKARHTSNKA